MLRRFTRRLAKKDFDAWAYSLEPRWHQGLPAPGSVNVAVEDIKFAYNAWSLLRMCTFYGLHRPKVLSGLTRTQPPMDIAHGGNRLFHLNSRVGEPLSKRSTTIALTPDHPKAVPLQQFPWREHISASLSDPDSEGLEIVLGMENGLSDAVSEQCDHHVYIAQYGSIGSLSMMSALAIATHVAVSACGQAPMPSPDARHAASPVMGHMPMSNHATPTSADPRPHETSLLDMSNADIVELLKHRRSKYPLQIGILVHNQLGDRNIGAVMRNANAFNCDQMIVANRRRFNRRGAVGTHHLLDICFVAATSSPECMRRLEGKEVWQLHQYYPYLVLDPAGDELGAMSRCSDSDTFIRHADPGLQEYLSTHNRGGQSAGHDAPDIFLDDEESLMDAVRSVKARSLKGIVLAVPEEGTVPHEQLAGVSHRVLHLIGPERLSASSQRGMNAAMTTAIALERIRTCIDCL